MSGVNETIFRVQHEWCMCKGRLNNIICSLKPKGNLGECRCDCKELHDWGSCEKALYMES